MCSLVTITQSRKVYDKHTLMHAFAHDWYLQPRARPEETVAPRRLGAQLPTLTNALKSTVIPAGPMPSSLECSSYVSLHAPSFVDSTSSMEGWTRDERRQAGAGGGGGEGGGGGGGGGDGEKEEEKMR